ncbi:hypothetical protein KFK09_021581 [Dendrobium nobile]|uniref:Cyclin-like domain-containing protein n=1 Tax=Dendrobium nobile TaxID=94219 RepID=A0A8T3AQE3_DENNO|nr:hypothetical protein KFK09_021581 [Dendrobium nobile]
MESCSSLLCYEKLFTPSPEPSFSVQFEDREEEEEVRCHCSLEEFSVLRYWHAEEFSNFFQNYLRREHKYAALDGYIERVQSSDELSTARFRGLQWILLVSAGQRLGLTHKTIFAAVNYLDRFLSASRPSRKWEIWMVELLSIACLSIASKFEEVCYPSFDEFQQMKEQKSDRKFDPNAIKQMEFLVLKVLDWKLNCVTSYSYIELLSASLSAPLMARITDLLIHTLCDSKFLEHNPSVVAVSVLKYAAKEIAPMGLDVSFAFFEALISEECKAKIDICSKIVEDHNIVQI